MQGHISRYSFFGVCDSKLVIATPAACHFGEPAVHIGWLGSRVDQKFSYRAICFVSDTDAVLALNLGIVLGAGDFASAALEGAVFDLSLLQVHEGLASSLAAKSIFHVSIQHGLEHWSDSGKIAARPRIILDYS